MKFHGPLDSATQLRVDACDRLLYDPARLEALHATGLMDSAEDKAFDRLAHLAAKVLNVPLTIISLIGDKKQFFKASHGLLSPFDVSREIPIDDSICRYTLRNEAIIADDVTKDALLMHHPTTEPWGIKAFIALPMLTEDGHVLGAFCAVDEKVRPWSELDIYLMRELTASVMTEINLRVQILKLKLERDLREKFVTALSHDLRNPLHVAKMGAEVLSESHISSEERASIVRVICDNVDRADRMIQDLLTASRIKAGEKIALDMEFGDIDQVMRTIVESLTRAHKRLFLLKSDIPVKGLWDSDRIRRIVENLAGNAVKYGAPDKPITIALKNSEAAVELMVHNHGLPIPSGELKNLFNLFERSESARSGVEKGWGIGLTVVRALAEDMGGQVKVESDPQDGTTFRVFLPKNFGRRMEVLQESGSHAGFSF